MKAILFMGQSFRLRLFGGVMALMLISIIGAFAQVQFQQTLNADLQTVAANCDYAIHAINLPN